MMKVMLDWNRFPSRWFIDGGLAKMKWTAKGGADRIAALLSYSVIVHHADSQTGVAAISYDALCLATGASRAKVAAGLNWLCKFKLITKAINGRGTYGLNDYDPQSGWAMLPAKPLYNGGVVQPFQSFKLRSRSEMDALKLYLLFAAYRSRESNMAHLTYEQIETLSGLRREHIRPALSILASQALVHIERIPRVGGVGAANAYRLVNLKTRMHMGTLSADTVSRASIWTGLDAD